MHSIMEDLQCSVFCRMLLAVSGVWRSLIVQARAEELVPTFSNASVAPDFFICWQRKHSHMWHWNRLTVSEAARGGMLKLSCLLWVLLFLFYVDRVFFYMFGVLTMEHSLVNGHLFLEIPFFNSTSLCHLNETKKIKKTNCKDSLHLNHVTL